MACSWPEHSSPTHPPWSATISRRCPISRPRSALPAGTLAGVSGYQIQFSSNDIFTPGDDVDALVAMNPAALRTNLRGVKKGGILVINEDAFTATDLRKAGYATNPLEDGSLGGYRVIKVPVNKLNNAAVKDSGLTVKQADRCKNFYALGLVYWLYGRPLEPTLRYIEEKFGKKSPAVALANSPCRQGRLQLRRDHRTLPRTLSSRARQARARHLSQDHWQRGRRHRHGRRRPAGRQGTLLRQLSHHTRKRRPPRPFRTQELPRCHLPGRG